MSFDAAAYKARLAGASSIRECEKVPVPERSKDGPYLFVSYAHKDYQQVYCDLADLYESGVPFWYDAGLPAGKDWDEIVLSKLRDPQCRGVIFYLSENLFLSRAIQTEIDIVCAERKDELGSIQNMPYFSVNLTEFSPMTLLQNTFPQKQFQDISNRMQALMEWSNTLANAFPEKATYLYFGDCNHKMNLLEQINVRFGISGKVNPYDLGNAVSIAGTGTITFPNGTRYEGQFRDGFFDGQGKMTYVDGSVYEGQWKDSKRHGRGSNTWSVGAFYEGEWQDDQRHGTGRMIFPGGVVYEGQWKNGKFHGTGCMTFSDGSVYNGEWKQNKRHGAGYVTFSDGAVYDGEWEQDKRHGTGCMTYPNVGVYNGEWKEDKCHGTGRFSFFDGSVYEGEWKKGHWHGTGRLTYASGNVYEGEWKEDKYHGIGRLTFPDGEACDGQWVNGKFTGIGVHIYPDGTEERGRFDDFIFLGPVEESTAP